MPSPHSSIIIALLFSLLFSVSKGDQKEEPTESRAYVLAGYIPQFFNLPKLDPDPFSDDPFSMENDKKVLQKYENGIITYLKMYGITPMKAKFYPEDNVLILTDTAENLAGYDYPIRGLFRPDMLLRSLKRSKNNFDEETLFKGDRLSRVGLFTDTTIRAFHGEVRKLEESLKELPKDHKEREKIKKLLIISKKYRSDAVKLYLEARKKDQILLEAWAADLSKLGNE